MKYVVFVFALFATIFVWSQELNFVFKGQVENLDLGRKESGVTVSIIQGASTIVSTKTASNGKYSLKGSVNYTQPFRVAFSKSGFVSKHVSFNLQKLNEEDIPAGDAFRPIEALDMTIFKKRENIDFSFLDAQPVGEFDWNTRGLSIRLDQVEKNRIQDKIMSLLQEADKEKADAEMKYQLAIQKADAFYNDKEYEDALTNYEEALLYKPQEKYPADRIIELDALIQAQKAAELKERQENEEYYKLIAEADNFRDRNELESAIAKYKMAITKKDEQYPKDQVTALKIKLENQKKEALNQAEYDAVIKKADAFFKQKSYEAAKDKYNAALELKPSEQYPKDRIKEINNSLDAQAAQNSIKQKYDAAIKTADAFFEAEKYAESKEKYVEALTFEKSSTYAKERISMINGLIAAQAAENERKEGYDAAIKEGDKLFDGAKWEEAIAKYRVALTFDDTQAYPNDRIVEINALIAGKKEDAERKEAYNAAITTADNLFNNSKWEEAKAKYRMASEIDNTAEYPKQRITEIDDLIQDQLSNEANMARIEELMGEANRFYSEKKLELAKDGYMKVLEIDASNKEADNKLARINEELALLKKSEDEEIAFEKLKKEGFDLANKKEYASAKEKLLEALAIKKDGEIRIKISELDVLLNKERDQLATETKYNNLISEAGLLESEKDYTGAIYKYREAGGLKPSESLPKAKIVELQGLLKEEAKMAELDEKYNAFMEKGDNLFDQKRYLESIIEYNNALNVKPHEIEPVDKAAEAERLEKAKGREADAQYEKILTVAQDKIDSEQYDRALELVNRAIILKPADKRPKVLLKKINALKRINNEYDQLMNEANILAAADSYTLAREKYIAAQNKKPNEEEPKIKISEMDRFIAALQSEAEQELIYQEFMTKGNSNQSRRNYEVALSNFQNALSVRPGDLDAQKKIDEIQKFLDDIANANAAEIEKKNKYDATIKQADDFFGKQEYDLSMGYYENALEIDASESYPRLQIKECMRLKRLREQAEAEKEYQKLIEEGDNHFYSAEYEKSIEYYSTALSIKNKDPYPQKKLAEIDRILNPAMVVSVELDDLGDPYENSLMDGQYILEQAEAERRLYNTKVVVNTFNQINELEREMHDVKTQEHYDNSNEIYQLRNQIVIDAVESDLNRQGTIEALRVSEKERNTVERMNTHFENSENIGGQSVLYDIQQETALVYGEKEAVYEQNTDILNRYNTKQETAIRKGNRTDYLSNINSDLKLTDIKLEIDQEVREDFDQRAEIGREIIQVQKELEDIETTMIRNRKDELLSNEKELVSAQVTAAEKTILNSEESKNNSEELLELRNTILEEDKLQKEVESAKVYRTNREIREVKELVINDSENYDANRLESNEILKRSNKELSDSETGRYSDALEKYVQNKIKIDDEINVSSEISAIEAEALKKKIEYVELMDEKAQAQGVAAHKGDELERLNTRKAVENIYANNESNVHLKNEETEGNAELMADLNKTLQAAETANKSGQKEKHYETQKKLNQIDATPGTKVVIANSLGLEYPEGVSQETFTRSDQNGLMTTIITRRIVVIEGRANVYIRTQTLNGITYSKNGNPSLSHVWQSETQGAHLERHY